MKKSNFTNSLAFFFFRNFILPLFILVLLKVNVFASINSIEVVPSSPSEQDQITINVHGSFNEGCWSPGNSTFTRIGNTFNIEITALDSWQPGSPCLMVIVPYFLTYTVGPLDTGKYIIKMVENHISLRHPDQDFSTLQFNVLPLTKVIHVPADAPTIQAGINLATTGDTVLVADGTYTGNGNRDIDFHGKAIVVKSENGPETTIVECQGDMFFPHRGFIFRSGEGSKSILEGFTIQGGYGLSDNPDSKSVGGGIYCASSPIIKDCIIMHNSAGDYGGGLYSFHAAPSIIQCSIENNDAPRGGGIYIEGASATIINSSIINNTASERGGGIYYTLYYDMTITNCLIKDNSAPDGGGLYSIFAGYTINNTVFSSNIAAIGGAIQCLMSVPVINNSTFYGNTSGIGVREAVLIINNSIISYSTSGPAVYEIIIDDIASDASLTCCDVFNNTGGDWIDIITDDYNINGNFSAAPLFCDKDIGNLQIQDDSPCAPLNNICGILIGALDIGCTPLDITDDNEEHLPNEFQLLQNYPNPFNPSTVIEFSLPTNSSVKITVYDILGQVIRTIVDERLPAGYHSITWDGKDKDGNVVSTGIYFYKLKANDFTESRKMILMK